MQLETLKQLRTASLRDLSPRQILIDLAILIVLPNLGFWAASQWLELGRAFINLDYLVCALVYLLLSRWLGTALLLLALSIDAMNLSHQIFPILHLSDLFYLLGKLMQASQFMIILMAGITALLAGKLWALHKLQRRTSPLGCLLLLNLVLCTWYASLFLAPDGLAAQRSFFRKTRDHLDLVASQAVDWAMMRDQPFITNFHSQTRLKPARYTGASQALFLDLAQQKKLPERILLIVNESWGVPIKPNVQDMILAPLETFGPIQLGTLEFQGATLLGELRELCHKQTSNGFNLRSLDPQVFAQCLPQQLTAKNYRTLALHAASGTMYDRVDWYPKAGFQHMTFFESKQWPRRCISFPGACDPDLLPVISKAFGDPSPLFFYWLTLNSHHPYNQQDILEDHFDCTAFDIDPSTESCRNLKLQAQFFVALARLLQQPEMAGVKVIVVGDHPPILMNAGERKRNFITDQIPSLTLEVPHRPQHTAHVAAKASPISQ